MTCINYHRPLHSSLWTSSRVMSSASCESISTHPINHAFTPLIHAYIHPSTHLSICLRCSIIIRQLSSTHSALWQSSFHTPIHTSIEPSCIISYIDYIVRLGLFSYLILFCYIVNHLCTNFLFCVCSLFIGIHPFHHPCKTSHSDNNKLYFYIINFSSTWRPLCTYIISKY